MAAAAAASGVPDATMGAAAMTSVAAAGGVSEMRAGTAGEVGMAGAAATGVVHAVVASRSMDTPCIGTV